MLRIDVNDFFLFFCGLLFLCRCNELSSKKECNRLSVPLKVLQDLSDKVLNHKKTDRLLDKYLFFIARAGLLVPTGLHRSEDLLLSAFFFICWRPGSGAGDPVRGPDLPRAAVPRARAGQARHIRRAEGGSDRGRGISDAQGERRKIRGRRL